MSDLIIMKASNTVLGSIYKLKDVIKKHPIIGQKYKSINVMIWYLK